MGSSPPVPSVLLNSFHELAHIILTPTLQNALLFPFVGWGNWLQAPCYFQTTGGSWWLEDGGRSRVPQSDLVSMKTLLQYLHCWRLSIPLWIEKMVLRFQFMHEPSKEDVQAANKMKLFFCCISSGAVTVSIEETTLRWIWPSFASLLCCQSTFQAYSFYLLLAQTHLSSYQHSLDEAKGILKVQKGQWVSTCFLRNTSLSVCFQNYKFLRNPNSLPGLYSTHYSKKHVLIEYSEASDRKSKHANKERGKTRYTQKFLSHHSAFSSD